MAGFTIDRTAYNALVDDSGSGTDGSVWDKGDVKDILDAIDAMFASGGTFSSYTPTLTNLTLGNGTMIAYYVQIGKVIHFWGRITLGSTSVVGSDPRFTLPVTMDSNLGSVGSEIGIAQLTDTGVTNYQGKIFLVSTTAARVFYSFVSGTAIVAATVTATAPFTFGTGDVIFWRGDYAAA